MQHRDERGAFFEFYRHEALQETVGHPLTLRQGNMSVSSKGVARGIHYALVPPGQAKYVTAVRGGFVDYIIDLRVGSPTFGEWDSVIIDDDDRRTVYLSEGLGHAIVSLTDNATVSYLVSEVFNPQRELGISVFDPEIGLAFPDVLGELQVSPKDRDAPTLSDALRDGVLPTWADSQSLYSALDGMV
ncbi:dTDP-4-dehydrorhamnose 3,5-epimerase [Conyzicola nivalis]|uniref:dTDP-4-dehydrorhamnose 3,5-epimerase n=1 Tax=Conyzicola nivalis TaxID=1477021 RepID=A0A916SJN4_9MICO|nr:dTDP-4-dehydrorhamnose 3,5-epimerase [Conyzicola nivalis]